MDHIERNSALVGGSDHCGGAGRAGCVKSVAQDDGNAALACVCWTRVEGADGGERGVEDGCVLVWLRVELECGAGLFDICGEGQRELCALIKGEHGDLGIVPELIEEREGGGALAFDVFADAARSIERKEQRDARRANG